MSSPLPGPVGFGHPPLPLIHTKPRESTKMPCSRSGQSKASFGPPQLPNKVPAASNSNTGGAADARCCAGIDRGRCRTQMWSRASTAMELTSPSTQLLGNEGHVASALNVGTFCAGAPAAAGCCADGMRATPPATRMPAHTAARRVREIVN